MRPASHMPLPARMILKPGVSAIAWLSSAVSVKRRCGERMIRARSPPPRRSRALCTNISVARMASGESMKMGAAGMAPDSISRIRSTISSCVRSTAKAGISRVPGAAAVTMSARCWRRSAGVMCGRSVAP